MFEIDIVGDVIEGGFWARVEKCAARLGRIDGRTGRHEDHAAAALRDHRLQDEAAEMELIDEITGGGALGIGQIDVHHLLHDGGALIDAVVDEQVYPAEPGEGRFHRGVDRCAIGKVKPHAIGGAACCFYFRDRFFDAAGDGDAAHRVMMAGSRRKRTARHHDREARAAQGKCDDPANSPGCASHQSDLLHRLPHFLLASSVPARSCYYNKRCYKVARCCAVAGREM